MRTMPADEFCTLAEQGRLSEVLAGGGPVGLTIDGALVAQVLPPRSHDISIRSYRTDDENEVVSLWQASGLTRLWNDPRLDIARKLADDPSLFLIAEADRRVVGTAIVGYDGHRGWVNYLAVDSAQRRMGIGRLLMEYAERCLRARGCAKLNLQLRNGNHEAMAFYQRLGYVQDDVVSLGKRLIHDNDNNPSETA
jgi:GNAT superfamily N-acetyltransferase